jgi:CRP/FNR family transcriptional regulator
LTGTAEEKSDAVKTTCGPDGRLLPFHEIDGETRAALDAMCRVRSYRTNQTVVQDGEKTDFLGYVLSGILRMQKSLVDGRQHIVGLLFEGDMFGRAFDGAVEFSIEAATDVEICAFPRAEFEALLMRSPDLDRAVMLNILNELDRARDWMIVLSNQKIVSRIAGFLLLMRSRFSAIDHIIEETQRGTEVRLPISRKDLAHLLGTRPESVSRAFHALQDADEISILEPDRMLVRDFNLLAKRAGEDDISGLPSVKDLLREERLKT